MGISTTRPATSDSLPALQAIPLGATGQKARGGNRSGLSEDTSTAQASAEREAAARINMAAQRATDAERDSSIAIQRLSDSYEKQTETESARQEALLESIRSKGYEQIRDVQRAQQAEIKRTQREGDKHLAELSNYYRNSIYNTEHRGDAEVAQLQNEHARRMEFEVARSRDDEMQFEAERDRKTELAMRSAEDQTRMLDEARKADYEKMKTAYQAEQERTKEEFQKKFESTVNSQDEMIGRLNARAGAQINQIRMETAAKLAAYQARQDDPFYKLIDLGADFSDNGDSYSVTLSLPIHEHKHVSAAISGDQFVISGFRSNQEELVIDPDTKHGIGSSSYQTYRESFGLDWPVDAKKLTKTIHENQVTFTVPKKGAFSHANQPKPEKAPPERLRQSRPQFPSNIEVNIPAPSDADRKGPQGSGTLG